MNWYFMVLQHYADFGGRARRKELWFYALFNWLLSIVVVAVAALCYADINEPQSFAQIAVLVYFAWTVLTFLPGTAVAVRRLHDTGKSGGWLWLALIPAVGGIWLLVWLTSNSARGSNRYGDNPKTAPQVFDKPRRRKSAARTLIVAASLAMLLTFANLLLTAGIGAPVDDLWFAMLCLVPLALAATLIIGGVFLYQDKQQHAFVCLFATMLCHVVLSILIFLSEHNVLLSIKPLCFMSMTLLCVAVLFMSNNAAFVRASARLAVAFSLLMLASSLFMIFHNIINSSILRIGDDDAIYYELFNILSILMPIAFILVASIFLTKSTVGANQQPAPFAPSPAPAPSAPAPAPAAPSADKEKINLKKEKETEHSAASEQSESSTNSFVDETSKQAEIEPDLPESAPSLQQSEPAPAPETTDILYVRFDIEAIEKIFDTGVYGMICYKMIFGNVPDALLEGCEISMGDSNATLQGKENICVIGIAGMSGQLSAIGETLIRCKEFMRIAAAVPFAMASYGTNEPLVSDGVYTATGEQLQSWAKGAFNTVKKESQLC